MKEIPEIAARNLAWARQDYSLRSEWHETKGSQWQGGVAQQSHINISLLSMNLVSCYQASLIKEERQVLPWVTLEIQIRERLGPGGLRGLQIRREALRVSSVGSTPIRSRQNLERTNRGRCSIIQSELLAQTGVHIKYQADNQKSRATSIKPLSTPISSLFTFCNSLPLLLDLNA